MPTPTPADAVEQARQHLDKARACNAIAHIDWDLVEQQVVTLQAQPVLQRGPLWGEVVTIKDLYRVQGHPMRAGTRAKLPGELQLSEGLASSDAAAVALLRQAGAVILGTTNMHEIALGATGENQHTGDVLNPIQSRWQAGGSSSGAGVAVALGVGSIGLGSDTGGSVRVPANFCGVVGFKPSFGAISLQGALPLSWRFDHAGPLTRSVQTARLAFEVLAMRKTVQSTAITQPRLAVPMQWLKHRMDDVVGARFEVVLQRLQAAGAKLVEVDTEALQQAWACYTPIARAQAAYIHREVLAQVPADGSIDLQHASGLTGVSPAVLAPLLDGRNISAQAYLQAQVLARKVRADLRSLLDGFDALALPTSAIVPPDRGQSEVRIGAEVRAVRELVLGQTLPFNVAGVPAISLPGGAKADAPDTRHTAPVGLQLVGRYGGDEALLNLAQWAEETLNG
jgi:aspartyl-tRNA(Asn)/glutamyl-tRNA(Gln) amidotransferase subunit A